MNIKDFIEEYNLRTSDTAKCKFVKEVLNIKEYIGIAEKISLAERVVKATLYERDKDGKLTGNIKIDSVGRFILFTLTVIDTYTDLEVDFNNAISEYDLLEQNKLIDSFIGENGYIPFYEYSKLQVILNMILDDAIQNNFSTEAFVKNQVTRLSDLVGATVSPVFEKLIENLNNMDEKTVEKLGVQIDKVFKKLK